ncbi:hypothetical protein [Noviherbaspirillum aerium]|uniref:hypothetical protein n=1 Tax=Noviherbaspirillum aerium TaxID=2588497 RepID=UPI00178C5BCF|nr:hypothetical protein [Noviherbaspirillum aerium]
MTTSERQSNELAALLELEKAVLACGLPTMMVSGQRQLDLLAAALHALNRARAAEAAQA